MVVRRLSALLAFLLVSGAYAGGRAVEVFLALPLEAGEHLELAVEQGPRVRLLAGRDGGHRGRLPESAPERPFTVRRMPGDHPEATPAGHPHPGHLPGGPKGPLWVFPVAWEDRPPHPLQGYRTGLHEDLWLTGSSRVPGPRRLRVHLPRAYLEQPERSFPVVYVLDGQNVFDPRTSFGGIEWNLDEVLARLEADGVPPAILVGIDNGMGRRLHEYTFVADPEHGGGGADEHLDFLLHEVEPFLAARYRIQVGPRGLLGSSLGGLFGLWAAVARAGAFRAVGALSPSLWWADEALLTLSAVPGPRSRLWMDMGTREGEHSVEQHAAFVERLEEIGWSPGWNLVAPIIRGAPHRERAWADRSSRVLRFLLESFESPEADARR